MHRRVSSTGIAALIEQVSRLTHSAGYAEGLYPAQWTALRFFSEAPASARTTAGLARFQGMSLGPVARTVRTLVDKGLLARAANPLSRRADLIAVTNRGRTLLESDPRRAVAAAIDRMPAVQRETLATAMEDLLYGLFQMHRPEPDRFDHDTGDRGAADTDADGPPEADEPDAGPGPVAVAPPRSRTAPGRLKGGPRTRRSKEAVGVDSAD